MCGERGELQCNTVQYNSFFFSFFSALWWYRQLRSVLKTKKQMFLSLAAAAACLSLFYFACLLSLIALPAAPLSPASTTPDVSIQFHTDLPPPIVIISVWHVCVYLIPPASSSLCLCHCSLNPWHTLIHSRFFIFFFCSFFSRSSFPLYIHSYPYIIDTYIPLYCTGCLFT